MGHLIVDKKKQEVLLNNKALLLTRYEFDILWLLASQSGSVFSCEELIDEVYLPRPFRTVDKIEAFINNLKDKIGDHYIQWIDDRGYLFAANRSGA